LSEAACAVHPSGRRFAARLGLLAPLFGSPAGCARVVTAPAPG